MHNTVRTEIGNLIREYEEKLKNLNSNQITSDAIHPKKLEGLQEIYQKAINDLQKILQDPRVF